ncbi:MAG: NYN domain-containing protein [Chloroflexi bacterium]|nr:NYN domain-containing protein [Chloroflexota bacterium]
MQDRVAIFIDGSNLYHALKDNYGRADLNFAEFVRKLVGDRRLFRTYYYNILQDPERNPDGYKEQHDFLETLRATPYLEVRLGTTKFQQGVPVEKGVDITLATDMLQYGWNNLYDVAILVSGDGDFAYALQTVKNMGKHAEVAYFERNVSKDLLDIADDRQLLNKAFLESLWRQKRSTTRRRRAKRPTGQPQQQSQVAGEGNSGPNANQGG